jgi:hypothetical protein
MASTNPAAPPKIPKSSPGPPEPASEVVDQRLDNLFDMIRQERLKLLTGPQITIYVGSTEIRGIYKRVALAASAVLSDFFTKNPESSEFRFPEGSVSPNAIRLLLVTWMKEACKEFELQEVTMRSSFAENIALLRASRLLGMERYVREILVAHVEYLQTELPSYEKIALVEQNARTDKDPLWTHMVSTLKVSA